MILKRVFEKCLMLIKGSFDNCNASDAAAKLIKFSVPLSILFCSLFFISTSFLIISDIATTSVIV